MSLTNNLALATPQDTPLPQQPTIAAASNDGQNAIASFILADSLKCNLFAAEPDVANPVALYIDYLGRVFVCESFRQEKGVEDNRNHSEWLQDDLAAKTVADRIEYMKKHLGDRYSTYSEQDDQIRRLVDTNGDGKADQVTTFANRFNSGEMGTGAGVLSYRGQTWFTCIPNLWRLVDNDDNGVSDKRTIIHSGFGVRFAFRGHDMHGLVIGPDGRLYFSIGDRGYHVSNDIFDPASGAVFRCELDGSNLEVIATGLRNPQELAFDNWGNLFTGDNNSDSGDKARWVFIVPGSDSGWRMHYQYLADRGPFNREKIWHPFHDETPAYIVPPIANIADGPSGLTFYPGTGFGARFNNRFLLCDFRGNAESSGIQAIENAPDGAFWKVKSTSKPIWKTLATDIAFGPDGKLYFSDWVFGWVGENKGRIYAVSDPNHTTSLIVAEVQRLLSGEIYKLPSPQLVDLLPHADRRVRQEAQFELAARSETDRLFAVALSKTTLLARVHAIWGLGQIARQQLREPKTDTPLNEFVFSSDHSDFLDQLLIDPSNEIRGQTAKLLGDSGRREFAAQVSSLLSDPNLRTRYFAAMALAHIGDPRNLEAVQTMLVENNNRDPIVRHAGIMAIVGIAKRNVELLPELGQFAASKQPAVRIAVAVALRKLRSDFISKFLNDPNPRIALEAARAIYDLPLPNSMDALASKISSYRANDPLVARSLWANAWLGKTTNANAIAEFAANPSRPESLRIDAIKILANWENPPSVDPFLGEWRPRPDRPATDARNAIASRLERIASGPEPVVEQALAAIGTLNIENVNELLKSVVADQKRNGTARANALRSLFQTKSPDFEATLDKLASTIDELPDPLCEQVIRLLGPQAPERATQIVAKITEDPEHDYPRIQSAVASLADAHSESAHALTLDLVNRVVANKLPEEVFLDVIELARKSRDKRIQTAVNGYLKTLENADDPTAQFVNTLCGGHVEKGKALFFGKTEVSCVRCHQVDGIGGEVGPDLSSIGIAKTRQYLLDSIVLPNKVIAEGYAQTVVLTEDGLLHTGLLKSESKTEIVLLDADANIIRIPTNEIEETKKGLSSMPVDLFEKLTPMEIRDLLEFLKSRIAPNGR